MLRKTDHCIEQDKVNSAQVLTWVLETTTDYRLQTTDRQSEVRARSRPEQKQSTTWKYRTLHRNTEHCIEIQSTA